MLFQIAQDLRRIQLEAQVDEADIGQVKVGQSATFTVDAYRGRSFPARIERLSFAPETVDGVVTYKAILSAANEDLSLRPGMTATARITVEEYKQALTVPNEALRYAAAREASRPKAFRSPKCSCRACRGTARQGRSAVPMARVPVYVLRMASPSKPGSKPGASDGKQTVVLGRD